MRARAREREREREREVAASRRSDEEERRGRRGRGRSAAVACRRLGLACSPATNYPTTTRRGSIRDPPRNHIAARPIAGPVAAPCPDNHSDDPSLSSAPFARDPSPNLQGESSRRTEDEGYAGSRVILEISADEIAGTQRGDAELA